MCTFRRKKKSMLLILKKLISCKCLFMEVWDADIILSVKGTVHCSMQFPVYYNLQEKFLADHRTLNICIQAIGYFYLMIIVNGLLVFQFYLDVFVFKLSKKVHKYHGITFYQKRMTYWLDFYLMPELLGATNTLCLRSVCTKIDTQCVASCQCSHFYLLLSLSLRIFIKMTIEVKYI